MCFLIQNEAYAAAITNLSNTPQTFEFETSEGWQNTTIEANETWRMAGDVRVKFSNRVLVIEHDMEYVIWSDGAFGPQRKLGNSRGFQ